MKAQRSFTVRPRLPDELAALARLASNLRWSWDLHTQELFEQIDPALWAESRHDPRRLLAAVAPQRLAELAGDSSFRERLGGVDAELDSYLQRPRWFHRQLADDGDLSDSPAGTWPEDTKVAYFSPEFGISEAIPQYSGGLGVLAGDHVKASSDLGVPLVAVGLFYRHGYFRQELSVDGWQQEHYVDLDPHALALEPCVDVRVEVELAGRTASLQVWRATIGRVPLYLLDADVPENPPELQLVTDRLYGGDVEHRLRQEIVLGIGGVRALEALGEPASVFHTNEGHAGFLGLERVRALMSEQDLTFAEAFEGVRAGSVFTTHTPVPAGIDRFPRELIEKYFSSWAQECGVTIEDLMRLGRRPGPDAEDRFNMAVMGMRLARHRNGVSELHGSVSRTMFSELWPGVPQREVPVGHITNGVHGNTWVSPEFSRLFESAMGRQWQWDPYAWDGVDSIPDSELDQARRSGRERLIATVRGAIRETALAAGRSPSDLEWVSSALDPDVLTICFARRMATHKRAALLLSQPDRLRALLSDPDLPVQFVFAGKAHPQDDRGKEMIRQLVAFSHEPGHRHRFVFVEDYDMAIARSMVQGADVWLNTPLRPLEASGTSGMKAVLNGALHCSVLDGWWAECFSPGSDDGGGLPNGWAISSAPESEDEERRSELEGDSLFELLENQVIPMFARRDPAGLRTDWLARVRESLRTLGPQVGAHRMVRDYVTDEYLPAAHRSASAGADDWKAARELAAFRARVARAWPAVRVDDVRTDEGVADLGGARAVEAVVSLGELTPQEAQVQLVTGHVGPTGELEHPVIVTMSCAEPPVDGLYRYTGEAPLEVAGRMGVTVRVVPDHPLLTDAVEFGRIAWAG